MFVGEFVDRNVSATFTDFFPNPQFMGCKKGCTVMAEYIEYLKIYVHFLH